ncbi:hypothetical protein [Pseudoalteromonas sp. T1lg22]|uniref:hypothetical protein n=1 Tax=Pseudoalteromonas sp. T1lg22 TaxID=2077096 RepID=UPI000CF69066|nr:hypothetical protein [Pseudoalteromonas sp. T1lg22]
MIIAKRVLNTLTELWPVLETLMKRFKMGDFSIKEVQSIIKQHFPHYSGAQIYKETNRLLSQDILVPLAKSSQLEINRAVSDFAAYLLQDESLGVAAEIHVLVDDLERLSAKLTKAVGDDDYGDISRYTRIMDERVRKIVKLYQHNENAIYNLVEQAKANGSSMSLSKRYKAVIEAFDEYIEPMLEMLDISGAFQICFDTIELSLTEHLLHLKQSGRDANTIRMLEQLRTRILDMHHIGRESLRQSADMLMPLREELRQNTLVTRQAAKILGLIRKRGLDSVMSAHQPFFASEPMHHQLGSNAQLVAYMAGLSEFEEHDFEMPDASAAEPYRAPNIPSFRDVRALFIPAKGNSKARKQQLIDVLDSHYPELESDELLYLYQKLINDPSLTLNQSERLETKTIAGKRFALYPFIDASDATTTQSSEEL